MGAVAGAALGGLAGKELFSIVKSLFANAEMVGGVQAVALGIITLGTLIYTICKAKISTQNPKIKRNFPPKSQNQQFFALYTLYSLLAYFYSI